MILFSKSFIPTVREEPKFVECRSHSLCLRSSLLSMVCSGIYVYLPLGLKVLRKIESIIRKHMNREGANELLMSALQPLDIWKKTGRDKVLQEVMIRFRDRRDRELCLGPTHEEEITEVVKKYINSYKQLPLILYQIQSKFRDEVRPRYGLVRSCEFIMKDAYSFDADQEGLSRSYEKMLNAYERIFKDCGLNWVVVEADVGVMGGFGSHEFMVPAQIGEDVIFYCSCCDRYFKDRETCSLCKKKMEEKRMIEVGHIFKLGTKYSSAQQAYFLDKDGKRKPFVMGCYGIGVSRLIPAIIEQNCDQKGIIWPKKVSGFDVELIILDRENESLVQEGMVLGEELERMGLDVLVDDRQESAGVKFNDGYLLGIPYLVILGKVYLATGRIEVEKREGGDKFKFNKQEVVNFLRKEYRDILKDDYR